MFAFADGSKKDTAVFASVAEGEHMDRELLSSIGTFASTVSGSDTMKQVAREIIDLVGKIVCPVPLVA